MTWLHDDLSSPQPGPGSLYVKGTRYTHTAAKFWVGLWQELDREHPGWSALELESTGSGLLDQDILYPAKALERDLENMALGLAHEKLEDLLAEMALTGPPGRLCLTIDVKGAPLAPLELPADVADTETFPYLAGWLLEWAGLPAWQWNNEHLAGTLNAEDREHQPTYRFRLTLTRRHLHEGLYTHILRLELTKRD